VIFLPNGKDSVMKFSNRGENGLKVAMKVTAEVSPDGITFGIINQKYAVRLAKQSFLGNIKPKSDGQCF
jgi:hypothetical protein